MNSYKLSLLALALVAVSGVAHAYRDPGRCNVTPCANNTYQTQSVPNLPAFDFVPPQWFQPTDL
ncbi:MAG: hypothetical protein H6765_09405 [Candidatus Peribacteria bacterium]|nr:MAG: hypothetical protein H6765_09405 [Candidatus Peribacteria bacterium]